MISLYTGTPGSGKTLDAVQRILISSLKGQQIIANFAIHPTAKQRRTGKLPIFWDNDEMTPAKLFQYAKEHHVRGKEKQTLVIIDECQLMFNCRLYNAPNRAEWCKFFSLHRHLGYDFILITQYDRNIDRQIRVLVEYEVKHRAVHNFRFIGILLTLFRIRLFIAIEKWYGINEVNSRSFFFYRKKYSKMYDSYANFKFLDEECKAFEKSTANETSRSKKAQAGHAPSLGADGGRGTPSETSDEQISAVMDLLIYGENRSAVDSNNVNTL